MQISVVAPCLNEQKNLPTFLESLVHQSLKDFEVIIVDGGSMDYSLEIIDVFMGELKLQVIVDETRNFGYIRNVGAKEAKAPLMLHTSVDTFLEPKLLEKIVKFYEEHPETVSLAGRTYPLGTSVFAHIGYQIFDFLRFVFTCLPVPARKYRPSGNFTSCRSQVFRDIGGYPHAKVNEDGLLGQKLDCFAAQNKKAVMFHLGLYVGHHIKKFEKIGGLQAIMFYFYTLGNLFPMFNPLLKPIEVKASRVFSGEMPLQKFSFKSLVFRFWNWL